MRIFLILLLLLMPIASAQQQQRCTPTPNGPVCGQVATPPTNGAASNLPDPIASTINFNQWMGVIGDIFNAVDAKQFFKTIAGAIIGIAAFSLGFSFFKSGGIFDGFQMVMIRIVIAATMYAAADPIGDLWKNAWHTSYQYSTSMMSNIYAEAAQQMTRLSSDLPTAMIQVKTVNSSLTGQSSSSIQITQKEDNNWLEQMWMGLLVPLSGLIYVFLSGFYTFSVMMSVLTIVLGKILFPLIAALFVLPGSTSSTAFSLWAKSMTSAVISSFFLPLLYGFASFVAVIIPLSHVNAFIKFVDDTVNYMRTLSDTITGNGWAADAVAGVVSALTNLWGVADVMAAVMKFTGILIVLPISMVVGLLIAGQIISKSGSLIAGLIGGMVIDSGYSNPIAGAIASIYGGAAVAAAGAAVGAVGGAVGAAAGAVGSAASAAGGAAMGAARTAGGAAMGAARTVGTSAAMNYGSLRPSPALNMQSAPISSMGASSSVGFGGAQVNIPARATMPTLDRAAIDGNASLAKSSAGQFVNDNYRSRLRR
ncbi:MAG: hypothetical protein RLZZ156_340 [Deinococcota bacterium]|jgi:hypothetical protein